MRTDRKGVGLRGWRDRDGGKDDQRGDAGAPPGPEQEAAGGAGAADRDHAGRAQRQPDGPGGLAAAGGRAAGHALPVDQPAAGQRAGRGRRGDGAARPRGPGPAGRGWSQDRADDRPDPGDRAAPGRHGGGAGGRPGLAAGLAGQGDGRVDRLRGAARGPGGGRRPAARGSAAGADGRSLLRDARPDRLVPRTGLGLAAAAEAGLLVFEAGGGETTLAACFARGERLLSGVELTGKRVTTHVAMVHQPGHPEPRIIAPSQAPTVHRAFDYGLRWGIEAMFSDFKTRGFGLEDSHLRRPERLDRLILVMALALFWAVSTGMWDAVHDATPDEKKPRIGNPVTFAAA